MEHTRASRPWQLPDGIDELAPGPAARVERMRRRLLDCAGRWGYELVMPPLAEFTDSLLSGVGEDLDLLTFKVPDQLSGRMLGIRADITPQVARMDAHSLGHRDVNRLCYAGSTLHTRSRSLLASRSPLQLGAELYGVGGRDADLEVIELMLALLREAGVPADRRLTLDLGHSHVFTLVLSACEVDDRDLEGAVFDALQRKSRPDLERLLYGLPEAAGRCFTALLDLHGDVRVLDEAATRLVPLVPGIAALIDELRALAEALRQRHPDVGLYVDLGELRGYRYHTGVVFAAYGEGLGEALAQGGRYDNVGAVYGRPRPATGFAMDLRLLAGRAAGETPATGAIAAPVQDDAALRAQITALRSAGETVIATVGGSRDPRCTRELVRDNNEWRLRDLPAHAATPGSRKDAS
jgi:ATP phosphoribosyltransferase regulatory subunit